MQGSYKYLTMKFKSFQDIKTHDFQGFCACKYIPKCKYSNIS